MSKKVFASWISSPKEAWDRHMYIYIYVYICVCVCLIHMQMTYICIYIYIWYIIYICLSLGDNFQTCRFWLVMMGVQNMFGQCASRFNNILDYLGTHIGRYLPTSWISGANKCLVTQVLFPMSAIYCKWVRNNASNAQISHKMAWSENGLIDHHVPR